MKSILQRARARWIAGVVVALVVGGAALSMAEVPAARMADDQATEPESPEVTPTASVPPRTTPSPTPSQVRPSPTAVATAESTPEASTPIEPTPGASSPVETAPPRSASPRGDDAPVVMHGRVADIVDGDTIDLYDGTRVRLAIVDTPEVHGGVEPCGAESSDFTGAFLAGQSVAIYRPVGAPASDRFGRLLGEVVRVTDGSSLNVALVEVGLGRIDERFAHEDPDLAARLRVAASGAPTPDCAAAAQPPPSPSPTPAPTSEVVATQHAGHVGHYPCHAAYRECLPIVGDLDCGEIGHSVELLRADDPYRLDREGDGRGCESNPAWSPNATYPYY